MPKKIGRFCIEHWRDGECIAKVEMKKLVIERDKDACRVVLPPGSIVLATGDELRFDPDGLIELLTEVRSCPRQRKTESEPSLSPQGRCGGGESELHLEANARRQLGVPSHVRGGPGGAEERHLDSELHLRETLRNDAMFRLSCILCLALLAGCAGPTTPMPPLPIRPVVHILPEDNNGCEILCKDGVATVTCPLRSSCKPEGDCYCVVENGELRSRAGCCPMYTVCRACSCIKDGRYTGHFKDGVCTYIIHCDD